MASIATSKSATTAVTVTSGRKKHSLALHRCRFPDYTPAPLAALTISLPSFDTAALCLGGVSHQRGVMGVGRANGDVELFVWGGLQGWISWRILPSSFPLSTNQNSKKPTSLLSHLLFTHQTTLSNSDLELYDNDLASAENEVKRLGREGCRLFGVGGVGSELVEWEWGSPGAGKEIGRVKSTLPTLPPIFSLAVSRTSSHLAIGCEDSTIRILNIMDDELELIARIELGGPGKVRALSLAWGIPTHLPPATDSSLPAQFATPASPYIIAGCSNSTILRFDSPLTLSTTSATNSSATVWSMLHRMTLDRLKGEQTVVWAVTVLNDGTIVSGDSMGNVKFWDGQMGTQSQSFKGHKVDVLCLAIGSDGTSVFTSGIDQKTVEYRHVAVSSSRSQKSANSNPTKRWVQSSGRRLHSHDVRAMVVSPPYFPPLPSASKVIMSAAQLAQLQQVPILTSGGLDLALIIVSVASTMFVNHSVGREMRNPVSDTPSIEYETTIHRRCAYIPQRSPPLSLAAEGRLLICRRERSVGIWALAELSKSSMNGSKLGITSRSFEGDEDEDDAMGEEEKDGWRKVLEMDLKLQTNLIASAISNDGKWLAVSDLYETKLFKLSSRNQEIAPRRQKTFSTTLSSSLPASLGTGSSTLLFSPDSAFLILATSFGSSIAIVNLPEGQEGAFKVVKVFGALAKQNTDRNGGREIRGRGGKGTANGDAAMNGSEDDGDEDDEEADDDEDVEMNASAQLTMDTNISTVTCLSISNDGHWLASADLERRVSIYDLKSYRHHTTLPTSSHIPSSLSFLPSVSTSAPTLIIALPTNALSLFCIKSLRYLPWSLPLSQLESNTLMEIREPALGVTFEPATNSTKQNQSLRGTAIIWGANWVSKIDLDDLESNSISAASKSTTTSTRKRSHDIIESKFITPAKPIEMRTTRRYQPLALFGFVTHSSSTSSKGNAEAVVVERTWFDLAKELPEAWIKSGSFGT